MVVGTKAGTVARAEGGSVTTRGVTGPTQPTKQPTPQTQLPPELPSTELKISTKRPEGNRWRCRSVSKPRLKPSGTKPRLISTLLRLLRKMPISILSITMTNTNMSMDRGFVPDMSTRPKTKVVG